MGVVSRFHLQIIMEIRADNFMHAYHWSTKYLRPDTDIVGHFAGAIWLNQPD
jgi:hypothetical protein